MISKGIRGAITVENNSVEAISAATIELLTSLTAENNIEKEKISHIIFTLTSDLNAVFPAQIARKELGFTKTAMMCFNEIDVPNSLKKCLRILIVLNCEENFEPKFVYLKDAKNLRQSENK